MGQRPSKKSSPTIMEEPTFALESHVIANIARAFIPMGDRKVEEQKILQIIHSIPSARLKIESDRQAIILRVLDMYQSLKPTNGLQGMLAEQMVGTHLAGLECLRLLANTQNFQARDPYMKQAERLMALYLKQLTALTKLQGNTQQKVTVENVNVASGGQAIVGNVNTGGSTRAPAGNRADNNPNDIEIEP